MEYAWLALAAPVALLTRTLTQEEILAEPRRLLKVIHEHCAEEMRNERSHWTTKVRWWFLCKATYLFTCEFCSSFWISGLVSWLAFDYRLIYEGWRGTFLALFVVMGVANVYMAAFSRLRVDLRKGRAEADKAESQAKQEGD